MRRTYATAGDTHNAESARLAQIRSLRKLWVIGIVVFAVLAVGYLLLPVTESATSVDGTQTASLDCGSVLSPEAASTGGAALTNASSICSAARHSNTTRVFLFGALAVVSLLLASYARFSHRWAP